MKRVNFVCILLVLLLSGCVLSNYPMLVQHVGKIDSRDKNITFLNQSYFTPNLISALLKYGFKVKPMPVQYAERDVINKRKTVVFNHPSARYGLTVYTRHSDMKCVFSENEMIKATLTVTDLRTGNILLTLQQEGSDGPCPPIPPIWDGLAKALAENWH